MFLYLRAILSLESFDPVQKTLVTLASEPSVCKVLCATLFGCIPRGVAEDVPLLQPQANAQRCRETDSSKRTPLRCCFPSAQESQPRLSGEAGSILVFFQPLRC